MSTSDNIGKYLDLLYNQLLMNAFIRLLYSILIAGAVVAFFGVGIYSFYQPPKSPTYPVYSPTLSSTQSIAQEKAYRNTYKAFQAKSKLHDRNVAIALLFLTLFVVAAGLWLLQKEAVLGEGLALGGIGLSIHSTISASIADSRIVRFLAITLLLAAVLMLAHRRFLSKAS